MDELIGAWRVVRYEVWDSAGARSYPFGDPPSGYAVFDASGLAFIQMMGMTGDRLAEPSVFAAYYGPYDTDPGGESLRIQVEGSNLPDYLGTEQVRPFTVVGDTLRLGIPGEYQATLARVTRAPPAVAE